MDPFFLATRRLQTDTRSQSYLEDVMRTYKNPYTPPPRKSDTYERALQYHEEQKRKTKKLQEDYTNLNHAYEELQHNYALGLEKNKRLYSKLKSMKNSKELPKADDSDNPNVDIRGITDSKQVQFAEPVESVEPAEQHNDEVQPEVLSTDIPDSGGSAAEHTNEG